MFAVSVIAASVKAPADVMTFDPAPARTMLAMLSAAANEMALVVVVISAPAPSDTMSLAPVPLTSSDTTAISPLIASVCAPPLAVSTLIVSRLAPPLSSATPASVMSVAAFSVKAAMFAVSVIAASVTEPLTAVTRFVPAPLKLITPTFVLAATDAPARSTFAARSTVAEF